MLEARDLVGHRGHTPLFSSLSFVIGAGAALVVAGPNGTGKTTLLRMLAGLVAPLAGQVRWRGEVTKPFAPPLRQAGCYVGHLPALKDELSAEENLRSLASLAGVRVTAEALAGALDEAALTRQRRLPARALSAGQRRRVALARLHLVRRPLWVLDEPLTALDAAGAHWMGRLLRAHLAQGGVLVAATHQPLDLGAAHVTSLVLGTRHGG